MTRGSIAAIRHGPAPSFGPAALALDGASETARLELFVTRTVVRTRYAIENGLELEAVAPVLGLRLERGERARNDFMAHRTAREAVVVSEEDASGSIDTTPETAS